MPPKSQRRNKTKQRGGGSSDYIQSWYASGADPAQLTRYGLQYVDRSPMFNPLQTNTILATPTTAIIPVSQYYDSIAPLELTNAPGPPVAQYGQLGGGTKTKATKRTSPWITHVKQFAATHGLNYSQALKHPDVSKGYVKVGAKRK